MNLKKHIALLLAFFLLASNSGMAFNVHYCGKKIAAVSSIFNKKESCVTILKGENKCCKTQNESQKKCCSNKEIKLELDTDTTLVHSFIIDFDACCFSTDWSPFNKVLVSNPYNQNLAYCFDANAPPLYKLYSQFLFYY